MSGTFTSMDISMNTDRSSTTMNSILVGVQMASPVVIEEDSRECPSQGASEMERGDMCDLGGDERSTLQGMAQHNMHRPFSQRVSGLCRHQHTFRERRDSSSFDSFDCKFTHLLVRLQSRLQFAPLNCCITADSDEEFVIHRKLLRRRHVRKHQLQKEREQQRTMVAAAVEAAQRTNFIAPSNNKKNKRKTPSPVLGEEPPSSAIITIDESSDTESVETEDDEESHNMPSPTRRVSLSPVSRRLAYQFETISFFSPVKPSQPKKRKTFDTSAACL
jgi:hypothetical protein